MFKSTKFATHTLCLTLLVSALGFSVSFAAPRGAAEVTESVAQEQPAYMSQEEDPRAIIKEGLYVGISKDNVSIIEGVRSTKRSYRLEENYKVVFNGQEIDWKALGMGRIPPHSVVKLIMFEGQVREIVLVEVSS